MAYDLAKLARMKAALDSYKARQAGLYELVLEVGDAKRAARESLFRMGHGYPYLREAASMSTDAILAAAEDALAKAKKHDLHTASHGARSLIAEARRVLALEQRYELLTAESSRLIAEYAPLAKLVDACDRLIGRDQLH